MTAAVDDPDPHLWLEEVQGEAALAWVREARYPLYTFLSTNDFHGQIETGRLVSNKPVGGAAYNMTYINNYKALNPLGTSLFDAGDVICTEEKMELAQDMLAKKVAQLLQAGYKPIVLGGGHEVAYGHFQGIHNFNKQKNARIGIINIDAHFDLRKHDRVGNSGTSFLQINELLKSSNQGFHYLALGIHEAANTVALFNTAKNLGAQWQTSSACTSSNLGSVFTLIEDFVSHVDGVYLSLDLDVINQAFAPGVSAPAPFGLQPEVVRQILKKIFDTETVISLDIAELNPSIDIDSRTAQLAAHLIYYIINYWSVNSSSKQHFV